MFKLGRNLIKNIKGINMGHSSQSVAKYFLLKAEEKYSMGLSPMKIIKLVYIAHGWMLAVYSKPLINDRIEAWKYGPVIPKLYHVVKTYRDQPIEPHAIKMNIDNEFNENEKALMDKVLEVYKQYSGIELSDITHSAGSPWDTTYNNLMGKEISNGLIEDYYRKIYESNLS